MFLEVLLEASWELFMAVATNTSRYWLNWRVLACGIWVLSSMVAALFLIWKYEGSDGGRCLNQGTQRRRPGTVYADESWRPCLKKIHPAWLLGLRLFLFALLLTLLIVDTVHSGGVIFYYYTVWTFSLVTIYFGLGSALSICGCYQFCNKSSSHMVDEVEVDEEGGTGLSSRHEENEDVSHAVKSPCHRDDIQVLKISGSLGYCFQIIYQTSAGAVVLTDVVFWFIIVPFLRDNYFKLNFSMVAMHSLNALSLLWDAALNSMKFPWFRISYFILWTTVYIIFQWALHASVSLWWPYSFLDLSSSYAPIWYVGVALLLVPCYFLLPLVLKLKRCLLSRWFPSSK